MITKFELDKFVEKYEKPEFIFDDPIQFPHRYKDKKDVELAGFISSLLAYGSRKQFINKLEDLFINVAQNEPLNFIQNFEPKIIGNFNYRFGKPNDFISIFKILKELYNTSKGLEELFEYGYHQGKMFETVVDYFYSRADKNSGHGFYHMIPNPRNGGAMKRMCMYLRWMVRKGPVDLGIWSFISPSELYIPLDVHVGRVSRAMGILTRSANDFISVIELTEKLKEFCPQDPIKYDFAIFGYGINCLKNGKY
ncbi:TIGR02757 family protein [bacterium]|nr:TIGR02757 family protein [bacterium]